MEEKKAVGEVIYPGGKYECDVCVCPFCGDEGGKKVLSVGRTKDGYVFRVRECSSCLQRWRTYEVHAQEFKRGRRAYLGLKKLVENMTEDTKKS